MKTPPSVELAVREAVSCLCSNLDVPVDLRRLAARAALSPLHFHRVFRGLMGETANALHRRLRLERAALALRSTRRAVTDLAFDAGYETHESFTRAFTEAYGHAPSAFRRRAQTSSREVLLPAPSGLHFGRGDFALVKPTQPFVVEHRAALRLAAVRHVGSYATIVDAFMRLEPLSRDLPEPAQLVARYLDDPETVPTKRLRSDAGRVVSARARLQKGLHEVRLPRGRYARTTHVGAYSLLGDAWATFMASVATSGHRIGKEAFEWYTNTPATALPDALVTQLFVAVE
ncbi:MAG: AraC family transcriptional regulator [Archangiaceae bacterium]|nr:AraC family transcriptional regulator [Archangiaceae bacterium]